MSKFIILINILLIGFIWGLLFFYFVFLTQVASFESK